jgi:hypothetical protein
MGSSAAAPFPPVGIPCDRLRQFPRRQRKKARPAVDVVGAAQTARPPPLDDASGASDQRIAFRHRLRQQVDGELLALDEPVSFDDVLLRAGQAPRAATGVRHIDLSEAVGGGNDGLHWMVSFNPMGPSCAARSRSPKHCLAWVAVKRHMVWSERRILSDGTSYRL